MDYTVIILTFLLSFSGVWVAIWSILDTRKRCYEVALKKTVDEDFWNVLFDALHISAQSLGAAVTYIITKLAIVPISEIVVEVDSVFFDIKRNIREHKKNKIIYKKYRHAIVAEYENIIQYITNNESLDKNVLADHILKLTCLKACSEFVDYRDVKKIDTAIAMLEETIKYNAHNNLL